jgi:CubicO group peptidase (beta-lactamase class C family)
VSGERALPEQASLRYLKLEAKRRRAAGEFPTLHDAQRAIAREHGHRSWAALREAVGAAEAAAEGEGHAVAQLRWIVARFRDAGTPGWLAPGEDELREHFAGEFLAVTPPDRLVAVIAGVGPELRGDLVIAGATPFTAQAVLAGRLINAATETRPPHRLTALQPRPLGERISDLRTSAPPTMTAGQVPVEVPALAARAVAQFGLVGLALAGGHAREEAWATATGWASLERPEPLRTDHVFPACAVTMAVTAVAVLCLAAGGRLRLDDRANSHLTAVRLADDAVTVRELLAHTAGVSDPAELSAPAIAPLAALTGPVVACTGKRGAFRGSHTGYAALGEIIAGCTGLPYEEAASRLVLRPLGMRQSRFLARWPDGPAPEPGAAADYPAVTGYEVAAGETFRPLDGMVCVFPAAGGLWSTAADLVRFALGWPSLLPRSLTAQALRPHATQPNGVGVGLGWAVNERAAVAGIVGNGPGTAASLLVDLDGRHACAALANREILLDPVLGQVFALLRGPGPRGDGDGTGKTSARSD